MPVVFNNYLSHIDIIGKWEFFNPYGPQHGEGVLQHMVDHFVVRPNDDEDKESNKREKKTAKKKNKKKATQEVHEQSNKKEEDVGIEGMGPKEEELL